jgi:hypothetical protein
VGASIAVLCLAVDAASSQRLAATDRISRTVPWTPGVPIRIASTIGDITITGANRADVQVEAVREAPNAETLKQLEVQVESRPQALEITSVQPDGGKDPTRRVTLRINVPRSAILERVELFEGMLRLAELDRHVTAKVERGSIRAESLSGALRLETLNGDITLGRTLLDPKGVLHCRVFNGDVKIQLAERPTDARILLLTLNGAITSAIPLTERAGFGPRFAEATLGAGEPVLSVDVIRGNISLDAPAVARQ